MSNLRKDIAKDSIQERLYLLSMLRRSRREDMLLKKRGKISEEPEINYTINDFINNNPNIKTWEYYLFIKLHLNSFGLLQINQTEINEESIRMNEYIVMKTLLDYGIKRIQNKQYNTDIEEIKDIINGIILLSQQSTIHSEIQQQLSVINKYLYTDLANEILILYTNFLHCNTFTEQLIPNLIPLQFQDLTKCFKSYCDFLIALPNELFEIFLNKQFFKQLFKKTQGDSFMEMITENISNQIDQLISYECDTSEDNEGFELDNDDDIDRELFWDIPDFYLIHNERDIPLNILRVLNIWPMIAYYYSNECFYILSQFKPSNDTESQLLINVIHQLKNTPFGDQLPNIIYQNVYLNELGFIL